MAKFNTSNPTDLVKSAYAYMEAFKEKNNGDATFFEHKGKVVGCKLSDFNKLNSSHTWTWQGIVSPTGNPQLACIDCKAAVYPMGAMSPDFIAVNPCLKTIPLPSTLHLSHQWVAAEESPHTYTCVACALTVAWSKSGMKPTGPCSANPPYQTMKLSEMSKLKAAKAQKKQKLVTPEKNINGGGYLCPDPECGCSLEKTPEAKKELEANKYAFDPAVEELVGELVQKTITSPDPEEDLDDGDELATEPGCECDECQAKKQKKLKKKVPFKDYFASQLKEAIKPAEELLKAAEQATEAFTSLASEPKKDAFTPWGKDKPKGGVTKRHWFKLEKDGKIVNRWVMIPLKLAMEETFTNEGWAIVGEQEVNVQLPFDQFGPLPLVKPCCRGTCCSEKCHKHAGSHACDFPPEVTYNKYGGITSVKQPSKTDFAKGGVIKAPTKIYFESKYGTSYGTSWGSQKGELEAQMSQKILQKQAEIEYLMKKKNQKY